MQEVQDPGFDFVRCEALLAILWYTTVFSLDEIKSVPVFSSSVNPASLPPLRDKIHTYTHAHTQLRTYSSKNVCCHCSQKPFHCSYCSGPPPALDMNSECSPI